MSAPRSRTPGGGASKSSGARSTASTSKPKVASHRACRPAPQATSSTAPPGRMKALQRRTQGEGGRSKWEVMRRYDAAFALRARNTMAAARERWVLFDWGGTLMSEEGPADIPMALWPEVRAIDGAKETLALLSPHFRVGVATNASVS